ERDDAALSWDTSSFVVDGEHFILYQRGDDWGNGPGKLCFHDWRLATLLETHEVPKHHDAPLLVRAFQRRVAWLRPLGPVQEGALSAVRWHDLGTGEGGDVIIPDWLGQAVMLSDGRILAVGRFAWLVSLEQGTSRRLCDAGAPEQAVAPIV